MNTFNQKIILPLAAVAIYACSGDAPSPDEKDAGTDAGASSDCIPNNPGGEVQNATKEHYAVHGEDCREASNAVFDFENGLGFWDESVQRRYGGMTECQFGVNKYPINLQGPSYNDKKECCYTAKVGGENPTYCEVTVKIPRWDGCDYCWDQYLNGLVEHEQGHVNICREVAEQLAKDIATATATACDRECSTAADAAADALEAKLNELLSQAEQEIDGRFNAYDSQNEHGETQGAVLNPDCR